MADTIGPLEIMALPFAECLILVGIHSYLGLHVLRRQVIFVDLALAQVAALGTTVAFLFGIAPLSIGAYVFSLLFTFIGAAVFSLTRVRTERIPQEAIIGLVYALAASMGILVVARAPHGAEHITQVLTGTLFYVKGHEVAAAALVYAAVGLFHYIFRHRFLAISENPQAAFDKGINVRWWDFLFYVTFGIVITHSVRTAGVLLVFVFLVVPAMLAIMLTNRLALQLLIGWGLGTLVSVSGLAVSYYADSATGPTVVTLYGAVLLVAALLVYIFRGREQRLKRAGMVIAGVAVVALLSLGFQGLGNWFSADPRLAVAGNHDNHVHGGMDASTAANGPIPDEQDERHNLLRTLAPLDIDARTDVVAEITDQELLRQALSRAPGKDYELHLVLARRLHELAPKKGCAALVDVLLQADGGLIRDEALQALVGQTGDDFGFDPWLEPGVTENQRPSDSWRTWAADCK
jgi:zinc/manganese transport system permease protein